MKKFRNYLVIILFIICFSSSSSASRSMMTVSPTNSNIKYVGLFNKNYESAWTGSSIELRFHGTKINALLEIVEGYKIALTAVVDGVPKVLICTKDQSVYQIASGLSNTEHHVVLFRRSEASYGIIKFNGFQLKKRSRLIPLIPTERSMLFIGDSITCGNGNEATDISIANSVENENGFMTYAAITARSFNADPIIICWSGKGLYRNRWVKNDKDRTIIKIFDFILPQKNGENNKWNYAQSVPDVIVINLGTNDRNSENKTPLEKSDYVSSYHSFIKHLRNIAPNSKLILSIGPMGTFLIEDWIKEVASSYNNCEVLVYAAYENDSDKAGTWHPSLIKHRKMADELIHVLSSLTGWDHK